jgi:uncharacterized protein YdeI (YjbR/CyaY-like superfamily)
MKPRFFATPEDFRKWLAEHHESEAELLVGFWKTHTGQPSITWPQSVDEVLCVGWIDGVRKRIDDDSYTIRFTPRRQRSVWSAVNVRRVAELIEEGRMQPAGLAVFEARGEEHATGYSLKERAEHFPKPLEKIFKANKAAWAFWMAQPPGYRRWAVHRVTSAKKEETRAKRLAALIEASQEGRRLQ